MRGIASSALDPRFFLGTSNPGTEHNLPEDEDFSGPNFGIPGGTGSYSSALSPSPAGPTLEGTQEYKDYLDTGSKLRSALQPNQVSMPRAIIGSLLSRRNPMLGSVITGDFQRNRQIQPLEQQFGLLGNMIAQNRAMENQRIANEKSQVETGYYNAHSAAITNPPLKPKEEDWSVVPNVLGPNGEPIQIEKNSGQTRILPLAGASVKDAGKAPNAVEGVKQSLLDAMNKGDKEGIAKYGKQLDALSDPSGDKAAMRALTMESVRQRIAEKNAKDTSLSPKAQQVLMETEPTASRPASCEAGTDEK